MLEGNLDNAPVWSGAFAGTSRFRNPLQRAGSSTDSVDENAWWIVVDGGGLPVARLWRPGTGGDDLPPAPWLPGRYCTVSVRSASDGAVLGGAIVAPTRSAEASDGDRIFSGIPPWRPWLPPTVTSAQGNARIRVPAHADVTVRVRAIGYAAGRAVCEAPRSGGGPPPVARVHLEREGAASEFVLVSESGAPVVGALVRDRDGWPLGLTAEQGRIHLSADARGWWVEERTGPIHAAVRSNTAAATLSLRPVPGARRTPVAFRTQVAATARHAAAGSSFELPVVRYWVNTANHPSFDLHNEQAFIQQATSVGALELNMLASGQAWFAAPGFAYDSCSSEHAGRRGCPSLVPALRISAQLVDEAGNPVQDAEIELSSGGARPHAPVLRQFLRTRSDGGFKSDRFPPSSGLFDLVAVSIDHPAFLPIRSPAIDNYCNDARECLIEMKYGAVVSGAVFDRSSGEAVSDAEVGLGPFSENGTVGILGELSGLRVSGVHATRTDRAGSFALRVPPGNFDLALGAPSHAFRIVRGIQVGKEGLDLGAVFLDEAVEFLGLVVDTESRPVAGAEVTAAVARTPDAFGKAAVGNFGDALTLRTSPDGSFRIPGLSSTMRVDLNVSANGYATRRLEGVALPSVEPDTPFTVRLAPGSVLAGRVTRNGEPTAGTFELSGSSQRHAADVLTGDRSFVAAGLIPEDGKFRIPGLNPDRYRLLVQTARGDKRLAVRVAEREDEWVDVDVGTGSGQIVGHVRERRFGLPGIEVRLGDMGRSVTDAAGRFFFSDVPLGAFVLEAGPAGSEPQRKHVRVGRGKNRVNFDFGRYRVSGHVVVDAGAGAPTGAALTFSSPVALRNGALTRATTTVTLGRDGRFDAELQRGRHNVTLDLADARLEAAEGFVVRGDSARAVIRVRGAATGRIVGRVLGLAQSEVETLRIEAVDGDFTRHEADLDANGSFVVERLHPGTWTVVGTVGASNRRATDRVEVGGGDVHADLTFERGYDLTGVVLLDGNPLGGAQVLVMRGDDPRSARRQFTRHDGSFAFRDLEAGRYTAAVATASESLHIPGDEWTEIRLLGGRVLGAVVTPQTAMPVVGASVGLWPAAASRDQAEALGLTWTSWTDEEGRFDFGRVPAGNWMLAVEGPGRAPRRFQLQPEGQVELVIHQ